MIFDIVYQSANHCSAVVRNAEGAGADKPIGVHLRSSAVSTMPCRSASLDMGLIDHFRGLPEINAPPSQ